VSGRQEFADGILSAVDFDDMVMERLPDPMG
jgi:cyanate lyase